MLFSKPKTIIFCILQEKNERRLVYRTRLMVYTFLLAVVLLWMRAWLQPGLPVNPREENTLDFAYLSALYRADNQGVLFAPWNPLTLGGNTNSVQRAYFLLAPLAYLSHLTGVDLKYVYIAATGVFFFFSGVGFFEFLRTFRLNPLASLLGAFTYMVLPPHLTLALDAIELNAFFASIPWILLVVRLQSNHDNPLRYGAVLGVLLSFAFFTGTTYFFLALPFLAIYCLLQICMEKRIHPKSQIVFLSTAFVLFAGLCAYAILPILFEYKSMWISMESQRRSIFSILSLPQIIEVFFLRFRGASPLSWTYERNHPDLAFYLGITSVLLSLVALVPKRKNRIIIIPSTFLIIVFLSFVSLRFSIVHELLKTVVSFGSSVTFQQKILLSFSAAVGCFFVYLLLLRHRAFDHIGIKKIALCVVFTVALVFLALHLEMFQGIFDHTVRVFLFITIALSTLAALGTDAVLSRFDKKHRLFVGAIILGIVVFDLFPFSSFFRSVSDSDLLESRDIYQALTHDPVAGRYYAPFPYKQHLPLYLYEYQTRFINRYRVNNENIYTPFTPLFSTHAYDVVLLGALEEKRIDPGFFLKLLDWGFTNHVLFRKEIARYDDIISYMEEHGWKEERKDAHLVYLKNTHPSDYVSVFSSFAWVPKDKWMDPLFWYQSDARGIPLFASEKNASGSTPSEAKTTKSASWERPSQDRVNIKVEVDQPSLVVISEAWFPGWVVSIDAKIAPIVRANYAFLGVIVPPGHHTVSFSYQQPWYYTIGKDISVISMLFLFLFLAMEFKKRKS